MPPDRFGIDASISTEYSDAAAGLEAAFLQVADSSRSEESLEDPYLAYAWGHLELVGGYRLYRSVQTQLTVQGHLRRGYAKTLGAWRKLAEALAKREITAEQYADDFHMEMAGLVKYFASFVGEESTAGLLGIRPGSDPAMIDAKIVAASMQ